MTSQADETSDRIERVAAALRSHNIETIVVDSGEEARKVVLGMIPEGAEVHSGKSKIARLRVARSASSWPPRTTCSAAWQLSPMTGSWLPRRPPEASLARTSRVPAE